MVVRTWHGGVVCVCVHQRSRACSFHSFAFGYVFRRSVDIATRARLALHYGHLPCADAALVHGLLYPLCERSGGTWIAECAEFGHATQQRSNGVAVPRARGALAMGPYRSNDCRIDRKQLVRTAQFPHCNACGRTVCLSVYRSYDLMVLASFFVYSPGLYVWRSCLRVRQPTCRVQNQHSIVLRRVCQSVVIWHGTFKMHMSI
jgi:hypothetical protein